MAVTTRAGKGSALSHNELDANFTILGLAHGDTSADLDVSSVIVNATASGAEARIQSESGQYDGHRFVRSGQTGATGKTGCLIVSEFTDAGYTVGQGTGYWTRIKTTDGEEHAGAVVSAFESVTDTSNFSTALRFIPVKKTAGTYQSGFQDAVLTVSYDKLVIDHTDAVYIQNLPTSDPASAGQLWNDAGTLKVSAG